MPKNKGKGGKNRRRGKNENESEKRELVFKEDGQEYAQVIKMLGNGRLEAQCFDGEKRLAHIRGKLRKKVWINQGDIILISLRDYQDSKADVILKYTTEEARNLKAYGELPENAKINETDTFGPEDEECNFEFDVDEFVPNFQTRYRTRAIEEGCAAELEKWKQLPGETIDAFAARIYELFRRIEHRGNNYPDRIKTRMFMERLQPELLMAVSLFLPNTIQEAIERAKAYELTYSQGEFYLPIQQYNSYQIFQD
nr:7086_t:CDS:2 [Entrophospora candida]